LLIFFLPMTCFFLFTYILYVFYIKSQEKKGWIYQPFLLFVVVLVPLCIKFSLLLVDVKEGLTIVERNLSVLTIFNSLTTENYCLALQTVERTFESSQQPIQNLIVVPFVEVGNRPIVITRELPILFKTQTQCEPA